MKPTPTVPRTTRRQFLVTATTLVATTLTSVRAQTAAPILGQGDFRYRQVQGWGQLGEATPVKDCHGLAQDRDGHLILLTNHTANNVIVYDRAGRLVHKWGSSFPGAHGLSLVQEGEREVLYLTDLTTHRVVKTTLNGTVLDEWRWPEATGKYEQENQYRPSWTLHAPGGDFYVLDGYGRDYIVHYAGGKFARIFGGAEGGIAHWGPHGGMIDLAGGNEPTLLLAMSDQRYLLRLDLDGTKREQIALPGGNPRQIRRLGDHYFVAHLADNWPADRSSRGFVSVLDASLKVVANVGGTPPRYHDDGHLLPMRQEGGVFTHPHDLAVDAEGSLYVAQFNSGATYPLKFERV